MKFPKLFSLAAVCALCATGLAAAKGDNASTPKPSSADDILAVVNGDKVRAAEFDSIWNSYVAQRKKTMTAAAMNAAWEKASKKELLNGLIDSRLLEQEAKKRKVSAPDKAVDAAMKRVKQAFKSDEDFRKQLDKEHLSEAAFRSRVEEQVRVAILKESVLKERVKPPSKEQLQKLFDAVKANMDKPSNDASAEIKDLTRYFKVQTAERVKLQLVFTTDEKRASEAKAKLNGGAKFEEVAAKYSEDNATARNGGEAGYVVRGQLVKEMEDAVFALPVGSVSGIIKTKRGYHIVRVEEKTAAAAFRFDKAQKALAEYMIRQSAQREFNAFVGSLKKGASITIKAEFAKS